MGIDGSCMCLPGTACGLCARRRAGDRQWTLTFGSAQPRGAGVAGTHVMAARVAASGLERGQEGPSEEATCKWDQNEDKQTRGNGGNRVSGWGSARAKALGQEAPGHLWGTEGCLRLAGRKPARGMSPGRWWAGRLTQALWAPSGGLLRGRASWSQGSDWRVF